MFKKVKDSFFILVGLGWVQMIHAKAMLKSVYLTLITEVLRDQCKVILVAEINWNPGDKVMKSKVN